MNYGTLQYCNTILKYKITNTLHKITKKNSKTKKNKCTVNKFIGHYNICLLWQISTKQGSAKQGITVIYIYIVFRLYKSFNFTK